jgi:hypothetical protein
VNDEEFLLSVAEIERRVVADVTLNTGDREFPDDMREIILGHIVLWGVHYVLDSRSPVQPTKDARDYVITLHASAVLPHLHSAFHGLASRGLKTRFGYWSDSPGENLLDRDRHDQAVR